MRTGRNPWSCQSNPQPSLDHWDMRTGRNAAGRLDEELSQSRSLGYAHWPEPVVVSIKSSAKSRSLGYAHWPELRRARSASSLESRSLGYAHWPELENPFNELVESLDHWDMRTGRNAKAASSSSAASLDHWDMRTGRNWYWSVSPTRSSLDHWDMRTGRNRRASLVTPSAV